MTTRNPHALWPVLFLALSVVIAATGSCGDDDDDDSGQRGAGNDDDDDSTYVPGDDDADDDSDDDGTSDDDSDDDTDDDSSDDDSDDDATDDDADDDTTDDDVDDDVTDDDADDDNENCNEAGLATCSANADSVLEDCVDDCARTPNECKEAICFNQCQIDFWNRLAICRAINGCGLPTPFEVCVRICRTDERECLTPLEDCNSGVILACNNAYAACYQACES